MSPAQCIGLRALILCIGLPALAAGFGAADDSLRMNQIQVIGTHNSYHAGLSVREAELMKQKNPKLYQALDYRHRPLDLQLSSGVRQIELDIFADAAGGRYAHPSGFEDPYFDPQGLMSKPGFKVMHVQDIDYRSTCQPLIACLKQIRQWSKAHPNHIPIFVLVETKQDKEEEKLHLTEPEPFTPETFDALDAEIRSVFSPQEL